MKIILKDNYVSYKNALQFMNMDLLERNREKLNLNFAEKCSKIDRMKLLFPLNSKDHEMKTRFIKKYKEQRKKGERIHRSYTCKSCLKI